ncbi:MAG: hypothetical protein IJC68_03705 [Firmicutes bacterium]|nr:hypothetical protein [Bacillota bacterium]
MKQWLIRFMAGRYGADYFSQFLNIAGLVMWLAGLLLGGTVGSLIYYIGVFMIFFNLYRTMSRNIPARQRENQWYLAQRNKISGWFRQKKIRAQQRKDYAFFACPKCKTVARVPKGKGTIRITCPKCREVYTRKS